MNTRVFSAAIAGTLFLASVMVNVANAGLITFDDTPSSIQNAYEDAGTIDGFDFTSNLDVIDVVDSTWNYGAHSGDFALLNNNNGIGYITASDYSDFTFDGLWVQTWGFAESKIGTLQGFNDGALVWSIDTNIDSYYQYIGAQAGEIDSLALGFGNHFLVDDLSLSMGNSIPEPSSLAIFGLALMGLASRRFKK